MNDIGIHLDDTFFSKSWKKRTFWDFGLRIGVRFFLTNIEKTHPKSSPKISLNIPNLSCPSQKNAPFFWSFWGKIRAIEKGWLSLVWYIVWKLGAYLFPNWSKKKVRFFEMDMINLGYLGRFWVTNRGAFFQYSFKKNAAQFVT